MDIVTMDKVTKDKSAKAKVKRLLYLRRELDNIIENEITETALREKEVDIEKFRESIIYHLDDNLAALRQGR